MSRRGYDVKPVTTFVGNHYLFSERQRLALARSVSAKEYIRKRVNKELLQTGNEYLPETVHIDGFNTVITLEVALSGSPVFYCRDGALRDLAGLRGTYRVIDKTQEAIELLYIFVIHGKLDMVLNGKEITLGEKQAVRFEARAYLNPYKDTCNIYNFIFYKK